MPSPADLFSKTFDLIVVGAGPVGLFSAAMAQKAGLKTLVIEKKTHMHQSSRSIGIHPPSLRLLDEISMVEQFVSLGEKIQTGHAYCRNGKRIGSLSFEPLPIPHNYILSIPQHTTESLLKSALENQSSVHLLFGCPFVAIQHATKHRPALPETTHPNRLAVNNIISSNPDVSGSFVSVIVDSGEHGKRSICARFILGCDGKFSAVRKYAGIQCDGKQYKNRYAMGDFSDNTAFGNEAIIFLSRLGLVESFPLPFGIRRWVCQQDPAKPIKDPGSFVCELNKRCGQSPSIEDCHMFSEFGVEWQLAQSFWEKRIVLAGDAAHIVSPIGGQGMNLGWINAADAVKKIRKVLDGFVTLEEAAANYSLNSRKRAKKVIRRAEINMLIGNRSRISPFRDNLVSLILKSPARKLFRDRFSMQGL